MRALAGPPRPLALPARSTAPQVGLRAPAPQRGRGMTRRAATAMAAPAVALKLGEHITSLKAAGR